VSAAHLIERPTNLSQLTHEPSATLGCSTNPSSIELVNSSSWPSESTQRTSTTSPDDHRPPSNKQLGPGDIVRPRVCSLGDESEAKVRERERREFRAQGFRSTTSASSEEPHRASAVRVTSMHLRRRRQRNGRRRDDAISKLFNLKDDTQDDERSAGFASIHINGALLSGITARKVASSCLSCSSPDRSKSLANGFVHNLVSSDARCSCFIF